MKYFKQIAPELRDRYFTLFHEVMKDAQADGLRYSRFKEEEKLFAQAIAASDKDAVYKLMGFSEKC